MELLVCGTAAAEGWPALFCHCEPCAEARRRGGKDLRSRSAYMLGEKIRLDFGPDSFYHQQRYGLAYERLEALLFSHAHADHLLAREFYYRRPGFSRIPEDAVLTLYGSERAEELIAEEIRGDWPRYRLRFERVRPFEPISLPDGITATPVLADHDPNQECVNYLFEVPAASGESFRLLVAHDTGMYEEPTWAFLKDRPIDLVLMDCTGGSQATRRNHMSCAGVCEFRDRLADQGSLAPGARAVATHFSHNGGWLHDELEAYLNPRGIEVACDGLRLPLARG